MRTQKRNKHNFFYCRKPICLIFKVNFFNIEFRIVFFVVTNSITWHKFQKILSFIIDYEFYKFFISNNCVINLNEQSHIEV